MAMPTMSFQETLEVGSHSMTFLGWMSMQHREILHGSTSTTWEGRKADSQSVPVFLSVLLFIVGVVWLRGAQRILPLVRSHTLHRGTLPNRVGFASRGFATHVIRKVRSLLMAPLNIKGWVTAVLVPSKDTVTALSVTGYTTHIIECFPHLITV